MCNYTTINWQIIMCHMSLDNLFLCGFSLTHSLWVSSGLRFTNRRKNNTMGFLSPKSNYKPLLSIYVIFENRTRVPKFINNSWKCCSVLQFGKFLDEFGLICLFVFDCVLHFCFIYSPPWVVFIQIKWNPKDAVILLTFVLPYFIIFPYSQIRHLEIYSFVCTCMSTHQLQYKFKNGLKYLPVRQDH